MTSTQRESAADPITLEIIQSSLQAIGDEMFAALRKTAMSAIIYEVLDMGTGITDDEGNLASSGAGIPSFVAKMSPARISPGSPFSSMIRCTALSSTPTNAGIPAPDEARFPSRSVIHVPMSSTS